MNSPEAVALPSFLKCYVAIVPLSGEKSLRAAAAYQPGEVMGAFGAREVLGGPSRMTLQAGENRHILLEPLPLEFTNHSCRPNMFFDTTHMLLRCLSPVAAGDELTFFYPSTEWEMASPFECRCGSEHCIGRIAGASQLPPAVLERYELTDFIRGKLKERDEMFRTG